MRCDVLQSFESSHLRMARLRRPGLDEVFGALTKAKKRVSLRSLKNGRDPETNNTW